MTWSYLGSPGTGDATARRDAVRFLVKDTNSARQLMQDEAIDFLLDQNGNNVWRAAADGCRAISAGEAKSKSVGDLSLAGLGESYLALAAQYDRNADSSAIPFAGGISVSDKENRVLDTDRTVAAFTRSLHSTPDGGSTGVAST